MFRGKWENLIRKSHNFIMKREIKQCLSTIPPISTKRTNCKQYWSTIPSISTKLTISSLLNTLKIIKKKRP